MEHTAWTSERFDDLSQRVEAGFARVDQQMRDGFARVDHDIRDLRRSITAFGGGIIIALIGVIAAMLARGA